MEAPIGPSTLVQAVICFVASPVLETFSENLLRFPKRTFRRLRPGRSQKRRLHSARPLPFFHF